MSRQNVENEASGFAMSGMYGPEVAIEDDQPEVPNRLELWREWNQRSWGGLLPGALRLRSALTQRRTMIRRAADLPKPVAKRFAEAREAKSGLCWVSGRHLRPKPIDNPQPSGSFGFASRAFEIDLPAHGVEPAELLLPLEHAAVAHLVGSTIRLAHWDPARKRFVVVPMSGVDDERGLAWGRTRVGGTFIAIGYPRDIIPRL
jgi:hypothetical protein